jgi:hypothetical protein
LLKLHPQDRATAEECLNSGIFDSIRNPVNEINAKQKIVLDFEEVDTLTGLYEAFVQEYVQVKNLKNRK